MVCLLIPGVSHAGHMNRIDFWQKNLSQVTTVMASVAIERDSKSDELQIQAAYEDIIKKFNEVNTRISHHVPLD